jgi:hypothetical protein
MLTDDKSHQVSNPVLVLQVYAALLLNDTTLLSHFGFGSNDPGLWDTTQQPYLNQEPVRAQVARSMTVHPSCGDGCTYPDFAVTGWSSATARADGTKLGIDPTKATDPTLSHGLPVYTSNFPVCMCGWLGTSPPGS